MSNFRTVVLGSLLFTLLIGLIFSSVESRAQQTLQAPAPGAQRFGSANCSARVPCPDSGDYVSASELATLANTCMANSFGMSVPDGFFDDTSGLDTNQCLSLRPGVTATRDPKFILPLCCIKTLADNSCALHCDLYNNWH